MIMMKQVCGWKGKVSAKKVILPANNIQGAVSDMETSAAARGETIILCKFSRSAKHFEMGDERHKRWTAMMWSPKFRGCNFTVYKFTEHNQPSELLNKLSSAGVLRRESENERGEITHKMIPEATCGANINVFSRFTQRRTECRINKKQTPRKKYEKTGHLVEMNMSR